MAKHKQPSFWAPILRSQSCPRGVKEGFVLPRRRTSATLHVFGACGQKWEITTFTDTAGAHRTERVTSPQPEGPIIKITRGCRHGVAAQALAPW